MPKLPVVSATDLIRACEKFGYTVVRQKGSHIRLVPKDSLQKKITIPNHKVIGKGLLRKILRDANITVEGLIRSL